MYFELIFLLKSRTNYEAVHQYAGGVVFASQKFVKPILKSVMLFLFVVHLVVVAMIVVTAPAVHVLQSKHVILNLRHLHGLGGQERTLL